MSESDLEISFGQVLRAERKRLGLTQDQLAERIGTSQQNVAGWEANRARPRREQLQKLIDFLNAQPQPERSDHAIRPSATAVLQALAMVSGAAVGSLLMPGIGASLGATIGNLLAAGKSPKKESPADIDFAEHEGPQISFSRSQQVYFEPEREFVDALPAEYRQNANRQLQNRELDYWSQKLVLEIKSVRNPANLATRGSMALHRLNICRKLMEREGRGVPPYFYLALVFPDTLIHARPGGAVQQVQEEAALLGFGCVMTHSYADVAKFVTEVEAGGLDSAAEIDGPEQHPDWGRF